MKKFFANVWTKRAAAIVSLVYAYAVCRLCYLSVFYDIHIHSRSSVCLTLTGISIIAVVIMLYTRKQLFTRIASFIILPAMLPVVLLYFGEWGLIMPIIITGILILLLSGAGEGTKTAVGTAILLFYVFGALGYFLFTSFFFNPTKEEVVQTGFSPSGKYRYRIVNTIDSSNGSTAVYIEPNYADKKYKYATFTLKNMERCIHVERPVNENISVNWISRSRTETTEELNNISDSIVIHLSEENLEKLGYTYDEKLQLEDININKKFDIGKTASDVEPIKLDELDDEQLKVFGIGREGSRYYLLAPTNELLEEMKIKTNRRVYISELTSKALNMFNKEHLDIYGNKLYTLSKDSSVPLASLTDAQLEAVGISKEGDVMLFNDVIIFRDYIAEAESYFDVDSRKISIDLLG